MTVMGTTHNTQPVTTPAPKLDLNHFASLKADAWWLAMSQSSKDDTTQRLTDLYSAIAILCRMQTMLTRECSRLLAEESDDMSEIERAIYATLNKI
jgi:hypothetical protein